ncbi:MAG: MliC family protein [Dokdonella sp.]
MRNLAKTALVNVLLPALAHAAGDSVSFPHSVIANEETRAYVCRGDKEVAVSYINTVDGDSLAYLPIDGVHHVFVTVLAGSGARYVSGPYVWWTKGPRANLTRADDADAPPLLADCMAAQLPKPALIEHLGGSRQ